MSIKLELIFVLCLTIAMLGSDCERDRLNSMNMGLMTISSGETMFPKTSQWDVVGRSFEHPESFDRAIERMDGWFDTCVPVIGTIDEERFLELEAASDELRIGTLIVSEGFAGTPEWDGELGFVDNGGIADLRWDDDGGILFADIVVNSDYAYDADTVERNVIHEIGHTMGLAHDGNSLDLGSCMTSPPPVGCRILESDIELVSNRLDF